MEANKHVHVVTFCSAFVRVSTKQYFIFFHGPYCSSAHFSWYSCLTPYDFDNDTKTPMRRHGYSVRRLVLRLGKKNL